MTKQRILLVDDHEVVRLGLKSLLDRHPNFEVVAEASTAREAVERVATHARCGCYGHPSARRIWN